MWNVAELNDEYVRRMEDVLRVYEQPHDPKHPVVCVDEKPVTLHAEVRPTAPAQPGRETRRDSEYERRGTANVFCAVEPQGWPPLHLPHTGPFGIRICLRGQQAGNAIPDSGDDPPGHG